LYQFWDTLQQSEKLEMEIELPFLVGARSRLFLGGGLVVVVWILEMALMQPYFVLGVRWVH
jgi:hypothetical protein